MTNTYCVLTYFHSTRRSIASSLYAGRTCCLSVRDTPYYDEEGWLVYIYTRLSTLHHIATEYYTWRMNVSDEFPLVYIVMYTNPLVYTRIVWCLRYNISTYGNLGFCCNPMKNTDAKRNNDVHNIFYIKVFITL